MSIYIGLDVGAVSVKLAAVGAESDSGLLTTLVELNRLFFVSHVPFSKAFSDQPVVLSTSPFTCMNGIVSEAIYPKLSRDYDGIPIRNFYFDSAQSDLDPDLGIHLELIHSYRQEKRYQRRYLSHPEPT